MKRILLAALVAVATTSLWADTITWTGGGDGESWKDLANWKVSSTDAAPSRIPLSVENSGEAVVISGAGVVVKYNAEDPRINGTESLTISDGAKLVQTVASWWYGDEGSVTIDGGTFDTGLCSGTHTWPSFNVQNGGTLIARTDISDANITLDATATYEKTSANNYVHTGTEKFTKFTATGLNVELSATAETATFDQDITWTCKLFSAADIPISWKAGSLVTWDTNWGGYYNAAGTIDIAEGWTGSFTFAYAPSAVFASCFSGKIKYKGKVLTAETFADLFTVEATTVIDPSETVHAASKVYLTPATDWKVGMLTVSDRTASGATVSATLAQAGEGAYSVYMAYGTDAITEANILSVGTEVTESDDAYTKSLTGLTEDTVYNYAFAIVTNGAVAAFKADSFVASDYDYIYKDGAWVGSNEPVNLPASTDSVLFASDYTTAGELRLDNKKVKNAVLTSSTMLYGTLQVVNSAVVNRRKNMMNQASYGFYGDNATPLNFVSESGNGTIYRASSYTCRCNDSQLDAFDDFFKCQTAKKILHNGVQIDATDYAANFKRTVATDKEAGTFDYGDGEVSVEMNVVTLTLWDSLPADASGAWTVKDGARVKLTENVKLDSLTVEGTGAVIDLNDHTLKVPANALTVNGEVIAKGTYTGETLPTGFTNGTVEVLSPGLVLVFR